MRIAARWIHGWVIPEQLAVPHIKGAFDEDGDLLELRYQRSRSVDFIIIDRKYYKIEEVVLAGETLTPGLVYSLLLMSIAGVSSWWFRYIMRNDVATRIAVLGVSSAIFMLTKIQG